MKALSLLLTVATVALLSASAMAEDLNGAKCLVNPSNPAKATMSAEFNGAKVYFCCGKCLKKFNADPAEYTAKANHQLFVTGQAKLVKCVFSGKKLNPKTAMEISGAKVCFCCKNCKKKVMEADDQIEMVFNKDAFAKGFEMVKSEE